VAVIGCQGGNGKVREVGVAMVRRQVPWLTLAVAVMTAAGFTAQLTVDGYLEAMRRDPTGLHWSQPWRVLSPLLVQSDGWIQAVFNVLTLVLAGIVVETRFGRWRWLVLYLSAGIVGQLLGYVWEPPGGGNSVAVSGLVGGLMAAMMLGTSIGEGGLPRPVLLLAPYYPVALLGLDVADGTGQIVGLVATSIVVVTLLAAGRRGPSTVAGWVPVTLAWLMVAEAVALLAYRDHHGAALLTGFGVGLAILRARVRS
jgi:membrane associated rhomboid family serine protease